MASTCTIVVERLEDGRYRATCPVFADLESVSDSETAARAGLEAAIEVVMYERLGETKKNAAREAL